MDEKFDLNDGFPESYKCGRYYTTDIIYDDSLLKTMLIFQNMSKMHFCYEVLIFENEKWQSYL